MTGFEHVNILSQYTACDIWNWRHIASETAVKGSHNKQSFSPEYFNTVASIQGVLYIFIKTVAVQVHLTFVFTNIYISLKKVTCLAILKQLFLKKHF